MLHYQSVTLFYSSKYALMEAKWCRINTGKRAHQKPLSQGDRLAVLVHVASHGVKPISQSMLIASDRSVVRIAFDCSFGPVHSTRPSRSTSRLARRSSIGHPGRDWRPAPAALRPRRPQHRERDPNARDPVVRTGEARTTRAPNRLTQRQACGQRLSWTGSRRDDRPRSPPGDGCVARSSG